MVSVSVLSMSYFAILGKLNFVPTVKLKLITKYYVSFMKRNKSLFMLPLLKCKVTLNQKVPGMF